MDTHSEDARPAARLTVLSGPSGVGIHRLVELVRARAPAGWVPVRVTTRPRRDREVDGDRYQFVDQAAFARMVEAGLLLEWMELAGRRYGTPRGPIEARLRTGEPVLLPLDLAGARQVRRAMPSARLVFLAPPRGRGHDTELRDTELRDTEFDVTIATDSLVCAAEELVGLLGSPVLL